MTLDPTMAADVRQEILNALRMQQTLNGIPPRAISQLSVAPLPVVSVLPNTAKDGEQRLLIVDSSTYALAHCVYIKKKPGWVQMGVTPLVTTIPTTGAFEGQQVCYDADASTRWTFQYAPTSAGTTYPWKFVGGPPMIDEVATAETETNASYDNMTTDGPGIIIPLDGDYDIKWGCHSAGTTATAVQMIGVKRGSATTDDADAIKQQPAGANYYSAGQSMRHMRMTGIVGGDEYKLQYKTNAGTATFERRWISATPARVGA